jgi:uncharacterized RDD family membrane protein YckC
MAAEELYVTGLTGIDMRLKLAGPGTRSYAFVIDWHIRLLLSLAWLLGGLLVRNTLGHGTGTPLASRSFVFTVAVPAALIYVLYHPVLEVAMHGLTPGKRRAGARIVTREGAIPGAGALLTRNLFRIIDSLPLFYVVGLVCCLLTARRVRIGDLAAGTLLVVDEVAATGSLSRLGALLARGGLEAEALSLVRDLLERWPELAHARRTRPARAALAKLERGERAAGLASLDEHALHSRLKALLGERST